MGAVLRHWRETLLYLSVFCTLLFGIAAARAKPSINLYVVNKEGLLSEDSAWSELDLLISDAPVSAMSMAVAAAVPAEPTIDAVVEAAGGADVLQDPAASERVGAAAGSGGRFNGQIGPVRRNDIDLVAVLNGYDATELQAISGIGPALANRIVEYRESIGGFESLDELLEVSGIGAVKLSQIERHLNQLFGR